MLSRFVCFVLRRFIKLIFLSEPASYSFRTYSFSLFWSFFFTLGSRLFCSLFGILARDLGSYAVLTGEEMGERSFGRTSRGENVDIVGRLSLAWGPAWGRKCFEFLSTGNGKIDGPKREGGKLKNNRIDLK